MIGREENTLGSRLRQIRESLNYSQQDVANGTGIPYYKLSKIESGTRDVKALEIHKIARFLQVTVEHIIEG